MNRDGGEPILIEPMDGANASMTLAQLFANCPILITSLGGTGRRVKLPTPNATDVRGCPSNPDILLRSTSRKHRIHPLTSARK